MGRLLALTVVHLAYLLSIAIGSERQQHHLQHGPCSFTFILPEVEHCRPSNDFQVTNTLQRDSPPKAVPETSQAKPAKAQKERPSWQDLKLESLESAMENNTQWLQKVWCPKSRVKRSSPSSNHSSTSCFSPQTFKRNVAQKKSDPISSRNISQILSLLIHSALSWDFPDPRYTFLSSRRRLVHDYVSLFKTAGMTETLTSV